MNFNKDTEIISPSVTIMINVRDKRGLRKLFIIAIAFIIISQTCFLPIAYSTPFTMPENFIYDLTWTGIKAGTASLELRNDGDRVKILSTAESAPWVSVFYTVEDKIESILSQNPSVKELGQPIYYRLKIREGRHRKNKEVIFDRYNNKAKYMDYLSNEKREYDVPPYVLDPISGFYYVRSLKLLVGESVYVTIFDNKKVWNVEVQVLKKEKITLPIGTINTVVVKPLMKSEGIFYRKGEICIWLTDDENHIPVKMQTKVAIGSITATLVKGLY